MNKLWILPLLLLIGFTPIYDKYDNFEKVTDEVKNMEIQVQDKQFRVLDSTPTLTDLEDHEIVVVSSNGWTAIMLRDNIDIFKIDVSCVTVNRGD